MINVVRFEVIITEEEIQKARESIWLGSKEYPSGVKKKEDITDVMILESIIRPGYWGIEPIIRKI